ncbi:MAG: hypothetical protein IJO05_00165 [Oscillospiraceae bacterium]|nr:hypothetical protein [Oscillospiraceae bacterium]
MGQARAFFSCSDRMPLKYTPFVDIMNPKAGIAKDLGRADYEHRRAAEQGLGYAVSNRGGYHLKGCVILLDGKSATQRSKLKNGDTVILMSPVSGG